MDDNNYIFNVAPQLRSAETESLIQSKARRLCRGRGFGEGDEDDVAQELRIHLWRRRCRFDPAVADWITFASFILDKLCASIRRRRRAACRSPLREECSLDETVIDRDEQPVSRRDTLHEVTHDPGGGRDRSIDIASILSALPDDARVLAINAAQHSLHGAGRESGLSRRQAARAVLLLREALRDTRLED